MNLEKTEMSNELVNVSIVKYLRSAKLPWTFYYVKDCHKLQTCLTRMHACVLHTIGLTLVEIQFSNYNANEIRIQYKAILRPSNNT